LSILLVFGGKRKREDGRGRREGEGGEQRRRQVNLTHLGSTLHWSQTSDHLLDKTLRGERGGKKKPRVLELYSRGETFTDLPAKAKCELS
jgi:hypothetical protein